MSRYSVIFCAFFCAAKNGDCSRKSRGHQTMTARSAAGTTSLSKLSRVNVVFLEQLSISAALPCGRHYFSPHEMATKNHRLSWHCRFKTDSCPLQLHSEMIFSDLVDSVSSSTAVKVGHESSNKNRVKWATVNAQKTPDDENALTATSLVLTVNNLRLQNGLEFDRAC